MAGSDDAEERGLRADDVAASHSAADGGGPSIQGARTHAHGTSTGVAAAVSCVWSAFALKALGDDSATRPSTPAVARLAVDSADRIAFAMEVMYLLI